MVGRASIERARSGFAVFAVVWAGQLVSTVGSGLTTFALGLWVYGTKGSITDYALIALCNVMPRLVISPSAGVLVDRFDRRSTMLAADAAGLGVTGALLVLILTGRLDVWHVYAAALASGVLATFHWPAWSAAITLLVPPDQLGRAAGLSTFAQAASDICAPLLAAALFVSVGVAPIVFVDGASFAVAVAALAIVRFPEIARSPEGDHGAFATQFADGWRHVRERPELLALLGFLAAVNLVWGFVAVLVAPLVLGFATPAGLGRVLAVAGAGMLAGSLLMSAWGGPRRRVLGIVGAELASGFAFVAIGLRPDVLLVGLGVFGAHLTLPIIFGCDQAIWGRRVPPELQGRVFAVRQMIERSTAPIAFLVAGPLVEQVFDPLLVRGGALAGTAGTVLGTGQTRGAGLLFVVLGTAQVGLALLALSYRRLRRVDTEQDGTVTPGGSHGDAAHAGHRSHRRDPLAAPGRPDG